MDTRDISIAQALEAINNGTSERKATKENGISRSTLQSRRACRLSTQAGHHHQQRLSPDQERLLCDWIIEQEERGYAPSHSRTREMATLILSFSGDTNPLRRSTHSRHPAPSDPRVYERFDTIRARHNTQQDNIWNMDEHGIGLGVCSNTIVLGASGKRRTYIQSPENREWVSVIEAISASGHFIRPLVMFKGKDVQTSWFTAEDIPNWLVTTTSKGWTSNDIGLRWLSEVFLPETARLQPNYRPVHRILLLDGHGSHATIEFMWIYLAHLDDATPVKKRHFVQAYQKARVETFTTHTLRAGWSAAGLFPWNPEKTLNSSQIHRTGTPPSTPPHMTPISLPLPPSTPKPSTIVHTEYILQTPKHPRDIYEAVKTLGPLTRGQRTAFQKVGKALGEVTMQLGQLQATNRQLQLHVEELEMKKRKKKVVLDPNRVFANVDSIKRSLEAEETARVEARAKKARIAEKKAEAKAKGTAGEVEALETSQLWERVQMESYPLTHPGLFSSIAATSRIVNLAMSTGREVRKRAAVKMNGGDFKRRSTARPSYLVPAASWKEYLIRQELIEEKRLESKFKAYTLDSRRAKEFRKNLENSLPDFEEHVTPRFKLQEILQTSKKKQPPEAEISDFAESNEEKLKVLSGKNYFVVDNSDAREILAVKVSTNGSAPNQKPVIPLAMLSKLEEGLYCYLCTSPKCSEDRRRHKNNLPHDLASTQPGGPPAPIPSGEKQCYNIYTFTTAQNDAKITNIKPFPGPADTWKAGRERGQGLNEFVATLKPLTSLLEGVFDTTIPNIFEIYKTVVNSLPENKADRGIKSCFGVWTSRSIVLNCYTDIHLDLKDVSTTVSATPPAIAVHLSASAKLLSCLLS
ncbi:DDE superfamily endonuclease-domain-containing protein [Tuber indicum]|nr:DDE superfamily endonuclease-domain-containing protein [Tuber indicum]